MRNTLKEVSNQNVLVVQKEIEGDLASLDEIAERIPELLTYAGVLSPFMELIEADGSDAELSLRQKNGRYFLFVLNFRPVDTV